MHQYHFLLTDPIPIYFALKLAVTWLIPILCHRGIIYIKYLLSLLFIISHHTELQQSVITESLMKGFLPIHLYNCKFLLSSTSLMVYTFHCAHSHLEMQLNDIIIVSVMVSDAYSITVIDPIPPKMADTDLSIWYRCIPNNM